MDSVTFEDVAVNFTQAEWAMLNHAQRQLYADVMGKICRHLDYVEGHAAGKASGPLGGSRETGLFEDGAVGLVGSSSPGRVSGEKRMFPDSSGLQQGQQQRPKRLLADSVGDGLAASEGAPRTRRWTRSHCPGPQSPVAAASPDHVPGHRPPAPPCEPAQGGVISRQADSGTLPSDQGDLRRHHQRRAPSSTPNPKRHECKVCNEPFQYAYQLAAHIREHHEAEKPYVCAECGKGFRYPTYLQEHAKGHKGFAKPVQCPECPRRFRYPCKLRAHSLVHTDVRPFTCERLGKSFSLGSMLRRHSQTHTDERPHDCPECGKAFRNRNSLARHRRVHTEGHAAGKARGHLGGSRETGLFEDGAVGLVGSSSPGRVSGEKRMFPDSSGLQQGQQQRPKRLLADSVGDGRAASEGARRTRRWTRSHCPGPQSPVAAASPDHAPDQHPPAPPCEPAQGGVISCQASPGTPPPDQGGPRRRRRRRHQRRTPSSNPNPTCHECKVCSEPFQYAYQLAAHIRERHEAEKPYVCAECGKAFRYPTYLQEHAKDHKDFAKPFQCPECPLRFTYPCKLRAHMLVHTGARPFACERCGKSFRRGSKLRRHSQTHTDEKPHDCPECGKGFRYRSSLAYHRRMHTDERPYACPQCPLSFRCLANLRDHQVTHTTESPFRCPECGKAYRSRSYFRGHLQTHLPAATLTCTECGHDFSHPQQLRRHVRKHHQEQPFLCHCGQAFSCASALRLHVRQVHAEDAP